MRIEKTYIKHWTIHVEADGRIYRIHHVKEHSAYKQLLAFLIRNGLLGRYLVFFIDGETKISDSIEKYFSAWDHTVYLDYHHLQEKIYDYMSSMIIAKRVDDPSAPVEYYKNGNRKGHPKPKAKTSLSRLFAKEASLIAWVGNTAALISYIRLIPAEYIKKRTAEIILPRSRLHHHPLHSQSSETESPLSYWDCGLHGMDSKSCCCGLGENHRLLRLVGR